MSRSDQTAVVSANILSRLRTGTAAEHEHLETRLNLLRPELTLRDYTALLARFYGFYEPWEQHAIPVLNRYAPSLYAGRTKTHLLENDLRQLGQDAASLPLCNPKPLTEDFTHVLGSVYVLEGSTLGSQLLARHFKAHLQLERESMTFFTGYAERTGSMWKAFSLQFGEAWAAAAADEDAVVQSARETFRFLERWLLFEDRHATA